MPACPGCQEVLPPGVRFCTQCGSPASPLSPPSPLTPGKTHKTGGPPPDLPSRYEVLRFLGRGGMGRVYLCRDTRLDVEVALKVLPEEVAADEESLAQIETEAKVAVKFRECPGILSLYGFEQFHDTWYLVMEFAAGGSLYDRLKKEGALPEEEVRRLGAEVAEALAFAHDKRVLHRDIKPANILLDAAGRTKVADFGIAKVLSDTSSKLSAVNVAGTPVYMAPEVVLQKRADHRTDLYSLGCMLYEMATGVRPFGGSYAEVAMAKVGPDCRAPDPRAANPAVSEELAAIIRRLLAPDPEERYASGRECAAALRRQAFVPGPAGTPGPFTPGALTAGEIPKPARRRALPFVLAVAVLAVAGAGVFLLKGEPERKPDPVAPPPPPAPAPVAADLLVVTRPEGALVSVDGGARRAAGTFQGLDPGRAHEVAASLPDHDDAVVTVPPWSGKGAWEARLVLARHRGTLEVLDIPAGAEIVVVPTSGGSLRLEPKDGRISADLETGTWNVRITLSGRPPYDQIAEVVKGRTATVHVKIPETPPVVTAPTPAPAPVARATTLSLETDPPGAEVREGEKSLGVTPLRAVPFEPGTHWIQILHPERDPSPLQQVKAEAGEQVVIPLFRLPGADLDLGSLPEGVTAWLNGNVVRGTVRTRSGPAEVVFRKPGFKDQRRTVDLVANRSIALAPDPWEVLPGVIDVSALHAEATVTIAGAPVDRAKGPLSLAPGSYVVQVRRAGYPDPPPRTVEVESGRTVALEDPAWVARFVPVVPGLPAPPAGAVPTGPLPAGARIEDGRLLWEKDRAEMVLVPAGTFEMGSATGDRNAQPPHPVTLSAILMDRHEVTNAQFEAFVRATGHRTDAERIGSSVAFDERFVLAKEGMKGADWRHPSGPGSGIEGKERHPVVCVSWNDADAYARWAGKRLPTEAEFERVLRGGLARAEYPWGTASAPDRVLANLADWAAKKANPKWITLAKYDDGHAGLSPAGSFPANVFGLFDVSGNVLEWCQDPYDAAYYATFPPKVSAVDPVGPKSGKNRVLRGGSFYLPPAYARCSVRIDESPEESWGFVGFRCVVGAAPPPR